MNYLLTLCLLTACSKRVSTECVPESVDYMDSAFKLAAKQCPSNKLHMSCNLLDWCRVYKCITDKGELGHRVDAIYTCEG